MPLGEWRLLSRANLSAVPDAPGVYQLGVPGEIIYIGMAEKSLRTRLGEHEAGTSHLGNRIPTNVQFNFSLESNPAAVEEAMLAAYKQKHGRLPRLNSVAP